MKRMKMACALAGVTIGLGGGVTATAAAYNPIVPTQSNRTITLDGKHMTIDDVVAIARYGAKVQLAPAARKRSQDAYELLLQGAKQGLPIYWFNRAPGSGRETVIFEGDPLEAKNKELLLSRQLATFKRGPSGGIGPEVQDEEIVRAMMAVRANTMVYEAASPQLTQMLLDLLNKNISPLVQSRGSPGEGDLPQMSNVGGTMVGVGQAYYNGQRMPAAQALALAGLQPLAPFAADDAALTSTNAYSAGQAALLVHDSKRLLDWSDLTFSMSMLGLNSSVTPLVAVPQQARPFPYQNWQAKRLLDLIKGSYLFDLEPDGKRIIQDPLSFRDYNQRNGAAWQEWAQLKTNMLIQINSSDHNPAVVPGSKPSDSWELDTPWLKQYYVNSGGKKGFILSNSNFVAMPWANDMEAFTIALAQSHRGVGAARHALPGHVLHGDRAVGRVRGRRAEQGGAAGAELHDLRPDGGGAGARQPDPRPGERAGAQRGGHGELHPPEGGAGEARRGRRVPARGAGGALGDVLDERPLGAEAVAVVRGRAGGGVAVAAGRHPVAGRQPPGGAGG